MTFGTIVLVKKPSNGKGSCEPQLTSYYVISIPTFPYKLKSTWISHLRLLDHNSEFENKPKYPGMVLNDFRPTQHDLNHLVRSFKDELL